MNAPGAEVPNVFSAVFEYPEFIATWTLDYRTNHDHDWAITFIGEKGTMILDRTGCRVSQYSGSTPEPWTVREQPHPQGRQMESPALGDSLEESIEIKDGAI